MGLFKKLAGTMLSAFKIGGPARLTIDASTVSGKTLTVQNVDGYAVTSSSASASLAANLVLASDASSGSTQPDFRALVAADIPALLRASHTFRQTANLSPQYTYYDAKSNWPTETSEISRFTWTASTNSTDIERTDCDEGYVFGTLSVSSTNVTTDSQAATLTLTFNEIVLATSSAKVGSNTILTEADVGTMAAEDAASYVAYASLSSTITDLLAASDQPGARSSLGLGSAATYNASDFLPDDLANGKIWIGDGSGEAQERTLSGDVTVSNTGVMAIGADKVLTGMILDQNVTLAKIVNAAARYNLIGRSSLGSGPWEQVATSANVFTLLGCADFAAIRTALSLVIGTNVQAFASELGLVGVKGSDIASASTTNLETATGLFVDVTGTTTITALGNNSTAGHLRIVRFNGALTLTHNGTSLILPTAANITTANGDCAAFVTLGSNNWKCVGYWRADGTPLALADNSVTLAKISGGSPLGLFTSSAVSVTGATTATANRMHICTGTSADYTLSLPATGSNSGVFIGVMMGDATAMSKIVTVDPNSSEKIRGPSGSSATTRKYVHDESAILYCNGTDWQVVSETMLRLAFRARQTTTQSISASTVTVLSLGATDYNLGSGYSTSTKKFTPDAPGLYQFAVSFSLDSLADGKLIAANIRKNGSEDHWVAFVRCGSSGQSEVGGTIILPLNGSTDYVEGIAYHEDTTSRSTTSDTTASWTKFEGYRISSEQS